MKFQLADFICSLAVESIANVTLVQRPQKVENPRSNLTDGETYLA
jgi:hypothetical protein